MRPKDRDSLHAAARMLGIDPTGSDDDESADDRHDPSMCHDWSTYLLAKVMYRPGEYDGPDWVPFNLWQATHYAPSDKFANRLIYSPGARELWALIGEVYDRPNNVATELPMRCAEAEQEWILASKLPPAKHRDHMLRLKASALAIAAEIDMIETRERPATGERFDFMRLYDEAEKAIVYQNVRVHNLRLRNTVLLEAQGRKLGYKPGDVSATVSRTEYEEYNKPADWHKNPNLADGSLATCDASYTWSLLLGDEDGFPGIVPGLGSQLRRLAAYFSNEAGAPPMQRPAFENAERNYFSKRICSYFQTSFGHVSPTIVARVVSLFFAQGITDNEVSKQIAKLASAP